MSRDDPVDPVAPRMAYFGIIKGVDKERVFLSKYRRGTEINWYTQMDLGDWIVGSL